jgi:oxygen-independent coproporphyrinogen-3 oxidase
MDAAPALQDMARDGLIDWQGDRLDVTPLGRPFVRGVAAAFDTYLRAGSQSAPARHSAAV